MDLYLEEESWYDFAKHSKQLSRFAFSDDLHYLCIKYENEESISCICAAVCHDAAESTGGRTAIWRSF